MRRPLVVLRCGMGSAIVVLAAAQLSVAACTGTISADGASGSSAGGEAGPGDNGGGGSGSGAKGGGNCATVEGCGGAGGGANGSPSAPGLVAITRFPRLSHFEWENTVRDLLALDADARVAPLGASLKRDAVAGFDNQNGTNGLSIESDLRGDYERAAETLAEWVTTDKTALGRLVATVPGAQVTDAVARKTAFVKGFAARAYRRPLATAETTELVALFDQGAMLFASGDAFADGARLLLSFVLQSPLFLYRPELGVDGAALSPFELASRLSYALTGTMPDTELTTAAGAGDLAEGSGLAAQTVRLLGTPAARRLAAHVHHQLYALAAFDGIRKDAAAFPAFTPALPGLLQREAVAFLDGVVAESGGMSDILLSRRAWLDRATAPLYGVAGAFTDQLQEAPLAADQRAGLLTRLGFLATYADAHNPDPIHRGVFISRAILCRTLPPPADNVTPVPATGGKTNRARVNAHTGPGTCGATCHAELINPLGFAFEHYDALGKFRATDNGEPVDGSGTFTFDDDIEKSFANARELSSALAASLEAHRCYARQWLSYLFGRAVSEGDDGFLDAAGRQSQTGGSLRDLVTLSVGNRSFVTRAP